MVKIVKTLDGRWGIMAPKVGVVMEPALFSEMVAQASALGVRSTELDYAVADMERTGNNCADFGISMQDGSFGFIFSHQAQIVEREKYLSEPNVTALRTALTFQVLEGNA